MAWQVAIVVDDETNLGSLIGWLPIWAWSTPNYVAAAPELRENYDRIWEPEPALTLINTPIGLDIAASIAAIVPVIEDHHSRLTALRVFGLKDSNALSKTFRSLGYDCKSHSHMEGILFVRPMHSLGEIQEIVLDATGWERADDLYNAFFEAVGAPDWHGRNFDALIDSIESGAINEIEVPYQIVIRNEQRANHDASVFLKRFADLVREIEQRGCPVGIRFEN